MPLRATTFLMFENAAEAASALYADAFPGSRVTAVERWAPGEPGVAGAFKLARFDLAGHPLVLFDSPSKHAFTFTPSVSIFVDVADEAELSATFAKLVDGGNVLMPPENYGFSRHFAWLNDRFGVSWQLNLP